MMTSFVEEIVQKASKSPNTSQTLSSKKAKRLNASSESSPAPGKNKKSKENKSVTQVSPSETFPFFSFSKENKSVTRVRQSVTFPFFSFREKTCCIKFYFLLAFLFSFFFFSPLNFLRHGEWSGN